MLSTDKILRGRPWVVAVLLVPALLMAGCGTTADTPTSVPLPTNTTAPVAAAPTDTAMVAPTNTAAMVAPTDTTQAAMTPTADMSAMTPTAGMTGTATITGTTGGATSSNATPVSTWKAGGHANTIPAPSKLVEAGVLKVGSDAGYPPQEYIDASGKAVGMDIDITEEIASRMGLTMKVVNFKFDDIIPALNAGQFDIVISAMSTTPERSKVVNFVPYFEAGQAVLVPKGNPKGIKTLADLSGKTVAVEQGTVEVDTLNAENATLAKANKPKITILTYPVDTDAVDQLRVGRADATMHDSPVAAYYAKLNPNFEVGITNIQSGPEGIAIAKTNKPMFDAVNSAITAMKADGSLDAIKAKWGAK